MDGYGGDGWTPSPWCRVAIFVSLGRFVSHMRCLRVDLYRGSFTKVARFDVA
jgi:hypothetical protein